MHKSFSIVLAIMLSVSIVSPMAYGFTNPLKSYNLYEDVHKDYKDNPDRETVMGEMFYSQNGLNKQGKDSNADANRKTPPKANPTAENGGLNEKIEEVQVEIPKRRNEYLRESAQKKYAPAGAARWTEGDDTFYKNPDLESIKAKYRASNFAGCMQECEAYVRLHPNDTLAFYYLAMCYTKADDKDNAIRAYEKVISLNANPMIVKYATNGRNCVIKTTVPQVEDDKDLSPEDKEKSELKCFENVNEPELLYPYRDVAKSIEMTPVDPQVLINRNINSLQQRLAPPAPKETANAGDKKGKGDKPQIQLPFGTQDSALDEFIRAPYGSGMSPELEKQYKQIQLKEFQQNLNNGNNVEENPGKYFQNLRNLRNKIDKKSESESIKIAMADEDELKNFFNSPEYIQQKKEMDQIRMMFGDYKSENGSNDLMDIIPALSQGNEKLSPQAMQMMMMQSVMPDIVNIDGNNSF